VMIKNVARILYEARQYDDAIAGYREALEMDPDFSQAQREIGLAYEQKGMFDAAETALKRTLTLSGTYFKPTAMADLAHVYAARGDRTAARQILIELGRMAPQTYVPPYDIAVVHAGLGERDQALASLQEAFLDRSRWMVWLGVDPRFDTLRSDPAFVELERRVGLPGR
jgi:tetratricopeptide (TPR) repeat protein